jgi:hypothetical protein
VGNYFLCLQCRGRRKKTGGVARTERKGGDEGTQKRKGGGKRYLKPLMAPRSSSSLVPGTALLGEAASV